MHERIYDIFKQRCSAVTETNSEKEHMMKKVLSLALASLLTVSLAATVGAMEGNEKLGTIPYVTEEIVIDGEMDAIYATGMKTEVGKVFQNASDATATCYLVHDGENLYLYAEVKDADMVQPSADDQTSQPWVTDSLELMIDGSNKDTVDVAQTRLDWTGWATWYMEGGIESKTGDDAYPEVKECAAGEIDGGYTVEMALNMKQFGVTPGTDIGMQYQINDVFSDGTVQANITITGTGPWESANYPVATVAPVTGGLMTLDVFNQADIEDDESTNNGNPIQLMDAYGCGYSTKGDLVIFEDVDFGDNGADFMTVRFGYGNDNGTVTNVALMLDDPDSDPVATMSIGWTGGWEIEPSGYISVPVDIEGGVHSLYFKFLDETGSLSYVYFAEADPAPVAADEVVDGAAAGTTTTAPATFDAAVVAAVAAVLSAAGYAVSKKR